MGRRRLDAGRYGIQAGSSLVTPLKAGVDLSAVRERLAAFERERCMFDVSSVCGMFCAIDDNQEGCCTGVGEWDECCPGGRRVDRSPACGEEGQGRAVAAASLIVARRNTPSLRHCSRPDKIPSAESLDLA